MQSVISPFKNSLKKTLKFKTRSELNEIVSNPSAKSSLFMTNRSNNLGKIGKIQERIKTHANKHTHAHLTF